MSYSYLFGPVPSRRLGISLGVDVLPQKVCNLNCSYCECGKTTVLTNSRSEYVTADAIIAELYDFLSKKPVLDVVTITGSGEPTLNPAFSIVHSFVKSHFPMYKTALLTNGTLLYVPDVKKSALAFDYVLPSLDAVSQSKFIAVNHPHKDLNNETIIKGIIDFSKDYKGTLWLEIFIIPGINDTSDELAALKQAAMAISPTRVQINTLDRPGTDPTLIPANTEDLQKIAQYFSPLPVEIISRHYAVSSTQVIDDQLESKVLATIKRRPSTIEDLASALFQNINTISVLISRLLDHKRITSETIGNHLFYKMPYGPV